MPNSLSISANPGQPCILVTGKGLWTPDQIETHFRKLEADLHAMRKRAGAARVLVDLGEANVQTAEVAEQMHHWTARIYQARDRVAVICQTALLAMQIKHRVKVYNRRIFPDREAAMAWLLADASSRVAESA